MNTSLAKKKSSQIKMKYKNWAMWKLTKEKSLYHWITSNCTDWPY